MARAVAGGLRHLHGISVDTFRNWEQGRREPQGPARALLLIADRKPKAFIEAMQLARRGRRAA